MKNTSSKYINKQRRDYALYILQSRAIPSIADGLKAGGRRIMWVARDGKKWKSASLAGACMPYHPHSAPEDAVDTLAAPYGNNIPLLDGIGSFGTRLNPTAYGASRYTSVQVSDFAEKVFYKDIEILPMKMNYDNTLEEPVHFLPLVPMCLVNPVEGVAIGFACDILSRSLEDIIETQLKVLDGKTQRDEPNITFTPFKSVSKGKDDTDRWIFEGEFKVLDSSTVQVTNLPLGLLHDKFINHLNKLIEQDKLVDYTDKSKDTILVECKFKRGELFMDNRDEWIMNTLGLRVAKRENLNLVDFDGNSIISPTYFEVVKKFTDWRLGFYKVRYERLASLVKVDIEKLEDLLTAIKHNVGGEASKKKGRAELKEHLQTIGIRHLDYIASLPVYRFTKEEKEKAEQELKEALKTLSSYNEIINSKQLQVDIYKQELKQVKKEFC
jgi:DNA gyrase/topoisomerase IV subunit A